MKMRIFKSIIFVAVALLISCQKEAPGVDNLPMQIEASLAGDTKGSLTTADLTDFYLQVVSDDVIYSYFEHVSKDGSGAWTTPSKLYWKNEQASVSYAVARFGTHTFTPAEFAEGVNLEVPSDQSTQELLNAADLLTMAAASRKYEETAGGALPVTLSHSLAKVAFTLTLGPNFYDNVYSCLAHNAPKFTVKGACLGFSFKPLTGAVSVLDGTRSDITPMVESFTIGNTENKTSTVVYEAVLVPQSFSAGQLSVSFTVNGYDYVWANPGSIVLESGKEYNIPISATAAPSRPTVNGHVYVEMGDGLKWATMNIGSSKPEEYGDYYAWGEVTTKAVYNRDTYKYYDDTGVGSYTRYNWEDYPALLPEDDAATVNWGGTWRIASDTEWLVLIDRKNFNWVWQDNYLDSGITGVLVISKMAGYEGNFIFLPAAGYLEGTVNDFAPDWGVYWSSTQGRFELRRAWSHNFGRYAPDWRYELRYRGISVRPVSN